jgi:hypothetical protein
MWPEELSENFTTTLKDHLLYHTNFTGLTGDVTFDSNGDRIGSYDIVNLQVNGTFGHFTRVGGWNATDGLTMNEPVIFEDGTTTPPADGPPIAPSPSHSKGNNNEAVTISVSVVGSVLVVAIISNILFFYLRNRRRKILRPPDFKVIEFGDFLKAPLPSKKESLTLMSLEDVRSISSLFNCFILAYFGYGLYQFIIWIKARV